jgi:hypothetical protein
MHFCIVYWWVIWCRRRRRRWWWRSTRWRREYHSWQTCNTYTLDDGKLEALFDVLSIMDALDPDDFGLCRQVVQWVSNDVHSVVLVSPLVSLYLYLKLLTLKLNATTLYSMPPLQKDCRRSQTSCQCWDNVFPVKGKSLHFFTFYSCNCVTLLSSHHIRESYSFCVIPTQQHADTFHSNIVIDCHISKTSAPELPRDLFGEER